MAHWNPGMLPQFNLTPLPPKGGGKFGGQPPLRPFPSQSGGTMFINTAVPMPGGPKMKGGGKGKKGKQEQNNFFQPNHMKGGGNQHGGGKAGGKKKGKHAPWDSLGGSMYAKQSMLDDPWRDLYERAGVTVVDNKKQKMLDAIALNGSGGGAEYDDIDMAEQEQDDENDKDLDDPSSNAKGMEQDSDDEMMNDDSPDRPDKPKRSFIANREASRNRSTTGGGDLSQGIFSKSFSKASGGMRNLLSQLPPPSKAKSSILDQLPAPSAKKGVLDLPPPSSASSGSSLKRSKLDLPAPTGDSTASSSVGVEKKSFVLPEPQGSRIIGTAANGTLLGGSSASSGDVKSESDNEDDDEDLLAAAQQVVGPQRPPLGMSADIGPQRPPSAAIVVGAKTGGFAGSASTSSNATKTGTGFSFLDSLAASADAEDDVDVGPVGQPSAAGLFARLRAARNQEAAPAPEKPKFKLPPPTQTHKTAQPPIHQQDEEEEGDVDLD
ncbi:unnamed protein product [Amoebophrya sp. A25]|nr:unnamed protein product [Amoebophrya sp. A25]|eukprot:GSA25T00019639001.1